MIKFKKISNVKVITIIRPADKMAYLFKVDQLTKKSKNEKIIDKTPINSKLYSISHIAKDGLQIILIQNK